MQKEEDKKPYELRQYRWKNEEKKDYMTNHDDRKYVLRIMGIPPEVQSSDILTDYFYKLGVSVKGCIFMRDDDRKQSSVYGFMALFTTDDVRDFA